MPPEEKPKRQITAHKGGRHAAFPRSRMTEEEREKLEQILAKRGISAADWVSEKIRSDHEELFGTSNTSLDT